MGEAAGMVAGCQGACGRRRRLAVEGSQSSCSHAPDSPALAPGSPAPLTCQKSCRPCLSLQVGTPCEQARAAIEAAMPAGALVLVVPEHSMVTMDFRSNRVRIFCARETGLVATPPRVG